MWGATGGGRGWRTTEVGQGGSAWCRSRPGEGPEGNTRVWAECEFSWELYEPVWLEGCEGFKFVWGNGGEGVSLRGAQAVGRCAFVCKSWDSVWEGCDIACTELCACYVDPCMPAALPLLAGT